MPMPMSAAMTARGDQHDGQHARAIAAERAQPQPRREHVDQLENQQAGEQRRQQVQLDDETERERDDEPDGDVGARDGRGSRGVHGLPRLCRNVRRTS